MDNSLHEIEKRVDGLEQSIELLIEASKVAGELMHRMLDRLSVLENKEVIPDA